MTALVLAITFVTSVGMGVLFHLDGASQWVSVAAAIGTVLAMYFIYEPYMGYDEEAGEWTDDGS